MASGNFSASCKMHANGVIDGDKVDDDDEIKGVRVEIDLVFSFALSGLCFSWLRSESSFVNLPPLLL